jgi:hypothetical protein
VVVYFGKERWVMIALLRARLVDTGQERFRRKHFAGRSGIPVDAVSTRFVHS